MRTSRRNPDCKRREYWGRGGAGVMFTCSEDGTVLLLLRAEWVEQGGTWGIPGGGIGEGFFRTPMQPITDLDVFRRKAQQEAEEECGALPPYMTSLPEGLPYTQYEDCGFRYVTFILDITKAQKDTWAPYSADGENDAFVWFPLADVKAGRPLPDEYGDLHDIHFGVKFTMANWPRTNPRRANPCRRNPKSGEVAFETLQSRVRPALRSVEASADFQRWFRGSKVVDEYGNPKVLYHGTSGLLDGRPFTVFQAQDAHPNIVGFFTENEAYAEAYGKYVYPVYLSLKKVFDFRNVPEAKREANNFYVTAKGVRDVGDANLILARLSSRRHPEIDYDAACEGELPAKALTKELFTEAVLAGEWMALEATEFVNYLRERGYDGVTMVEEGNINYAVFDPRKIKSVTGNRGTFDANDPDIRHNPRTYRIR